MKSTILSKFSFTLLFIVVGLLPMLLVSIIATYSGTQDIKQKVYNQLTAINQIKKQAVTTYFKERRSDLKVLGNTVDTLSSQAFSKLANVQELKKSQLLDYLNNNKVHLSFLASQLNVKTDLVAISQAFSTPLRWQALLDQFDQNYAQLLTHFGWYDMFFVNLNGDIVYSVTRESDLGQNLIKDLSQSSFNQAFNLAQSRGDEQISFADYLPYSPSNNAPAAFGIKPISQNGKRLGYIAYQLPIEKINQILGQRSGMGETGESYLVGQDNLMRSDSHRNPEKFSVSASFELQNKIKTKAAIAGLSGQKGTGIIIDYIDRQVLSSWDYIELGDGLRWALISEIDVSEALTPKTSRNQEYYQHYIEQYGYYDLFLIQPDGYILYSVKKDSAYHTNILKGPFEDTNLAKLIRQVKKSGRYAMVDYAPYEPNNHEPAAFIAQPIKDKNGTTLLYLALEIPTEGISKIMDNRKGMGETGESFLVGPDLRMRSTPYKDPLLHNVKASLMGSIEENGMNSETIKQALAGKSGTDLILDYNGQPVLSSYDRIKFDDFNWAIVSEIDEVEAFASTYENIYLICAIMLLSIVLIGILGFFIARR